MASVGLGTERSVVSDADYLLALTLQALTPGTGSTAAVDNQLATTAIGSIPAPGATVTYTYRTTLYVRTGWQGLIEYNGTGTSTAIQPPTPACITGDAPTDPPGAGALRKYIFGSYIDEPIVLITSRNPDGTISVGEQLYYYHTNRMYCTTALSDASGGIIGRYTYTPYGFTTLSSFNRAF